MNAALYHRYCRYSDLHSLPPVSPSDSLRRHLISHHVNVAWHGSQLPLL